MKWSSSTENSATRSAARSTSSLWSSEVSSKVSKFKIKDFVVLVDDEDYEVITQHVWRVLSNGNKHYRVVSGSKSMPLSRFILNVPKDDKRVVDHISGDPFDNRKSNLRLVPREINN